MRSALVNKRYYLAGTAVSSLGDGAQAIAIIWSVYELQGDPLLVGSLIAASYAPALILSPFFGTFADRIDVRRATVMSDVARFAIILTLTLVFAFQPTESVRIWALFITQVVVATIYTLFRATSQKMIRLSFDTKDIRSVISLASSFSMAFTVAGTGFAGYLIAHASPVWCFAINALTFLASAACFSRLRPSAVQQSAHNSRSAYWRELSEGFQYVLGSRNMLLIVLLAIPSSGILQGLNTLIAPYAKEILAGGPGLFATLDIMASVGGFISGLVLHRFEWAQRYVLRFALLGMAGASLLLATFSTPTTSILGFFLLGLFTLMHIVSTQTAANLVAPERLVGRVVSIRLVVVSVAKIAFALLAGWLGSVVGPAGGFLCFAVISLVTFALLGTRSISTEPASLAKQPNAS